MATPLSEKPPLYKSLLNESMESISAPPKAEKFIRSTPILTKRTNLSAPIGSISKPRKKPGLPSEYESELSCNGLEHTQEHTQEQQKSINNQKNYNKPQQESIVRENSLVCEPNSNVKLQQNPTQLIDVKNSLSENPKQMNGVKNSVSKSSKLSSPTLKIKQDDSYIKPFKQANSSSFISIDEDSTKLNNCIPRRHTEVVSSFDTQNLSVHTQPTNDLFKRSNTTDVSSKELFRNETKLAVLEFLSSLTPDKITARNVASRSNSRVSRSSSRVSNVNTSSNLSDLVVCPTGSNENNQNKIHLEELSKIENGEKSKTLPRDQRQKCSPEVASEEIANLKTEQKRLKVTAAKIAAVKEKLRKMKGPVEKWISSNMKREIITFDAKTKLKRTSDKVTKQICYCKKSQRPLIVSIPQRNIINFQDIADDFTPHTYSVNRLEELSKEIMNIFPDIGSQDVDALLRPFENNDIFLYESFFKIAKDIYNQNLFTVSGSVWTGVALVLHTVKETIFSGNLDDAQLELLVEYSTKFVTENVDEIENTIELSSDEEYKSDPEGQINLTNQFVENLSYTQKIVNVVNKWTPFGIAALAVGMILAYNYIKY